MRFASLLGFPLVLAACSPSSNGHGNVTAPTGGSAAEAPDASAATPVTKPEPTAEADAGAEQGRLCGCGLCEPVIGEDSCASDSDCAAATPCHATKCVDKAKAQPRTPGMQCTMIMRCDSVDANRCACVSGKCSLAPRASNP